MGAPGIQTGYRRIGSLLQQAQFDVEVFGEQRSQLGLESRVRLHFGIRHDYDQLTLTPIG